MGKPNDMSDKKTTTKAANLMKKFFIRTEKEVGDLTYDDGFRDGIIIMMIVVYLIGAIVVLFEIFG